MLPTWALHRNIESAAPWNWFVQEKKSSTICCSGYPEFTNRWNTIVSNYSIWDSADLMFVSLNNWKLSMEVICTYLNGLSQLKILCTLRKGERRRTRLLHGDADRATAQACWECWVGNWTGIVRGGGTDLIIRRTERIHEQEFGRERVNTAFKTKGLIRSAPMMRMYVYKRVKECRYIFCNDI